MYHTKYRHITGNMNDMELESGESGLESFVANVRTCWLVIAYSREPLPSLVSKKSRKATLTTSKSSGEVELSGAAAVGGLTNKHVTFP